MGCRALNVTGEYFNELVEYYENESNLDVAKELSLQPRIGGQLAPQLQLEPTFSLNEYKRVLAGWHPKEEIKLNKNAMVWNQDTQEFEHGKKMHRAGTELLFTVDKSITLLRYAVDDDTRKKLDEAWDLSLKRAMEAAEKLSKVKLGTDGKEVVGAEKILWFGFKHLETRPTEFKKDGVESLEAEDTIQLSNGDLINSKGEVVEKKKQDTRPEPHEHFHVLIANVTERNGEYFALDNSDIVKNVELIDAIFQSTLRLEIEKLGIRTEDKILLEDEENAFKENKKVQSFKIKEFDDVVDDFSNRSKIIKSLMSQKGYSKDTAFNASRHSKEQIGNRELFEQFQDTLEPYHLKDKLLEAQSNSNIRADRASKPIDIIAKVHDKVKDSTFTYEQFKATCLKELSGKNGFDTYEKVEKETERMFQDLVDTQYYIPKDLPERENELIQKLINETPETLLDEYEKKQAQVVFQRHVRFTSTWFKTLEKDTINNLKQCNTQESFDTNEVKQFVSNFEAIVSAEKGKTFKYTPSQRMAIIDYLSHQDSSVLQAPAGSGKSTALRCIYEFYRSKGYTVIATAPSAEATKNLANSIRLQTDGKSYAMNVAELLTQHKTGNKSLFDKLGKTIILSDEMGTCATEDLHKLSGLIADPNHGGRIILVGDKEQKQSVGAGGLFRHLQSEFRTSELTEINRQREDWQKEMAYNLFKGDSKASIEALYKNDKIIVSSTTSERIKAIVSDYVNDPFSHLEKTGIAVTKADSWMLNNLVRKELKARGEVEQNGFQVTGKDKRVREFSKGDRIIITENFKSGEEENSNRDLTKIRNSQRGVIVDISTRGQEPDQTATFTIQFDDGTIQKVFNRDLHRLQHSYFVNSYKQQGNTVKNAYYYCDPSLMDKHEAYVSLTRQEENVKVYIDFEDIKKNEKRLDTESTQGMKNAVFNIAQKNEIEINDLDINSFLECREFLNEHLYQLGDIKQDEKDRYVLQCLQDLIEASQKTNYKKTTFDFNYEKVYVLGVYSDLKPKVENDVSMEVTHTAKPEIKLDAPAPTAEPTQEIKPTPPNQIRFTKPKKVKDKNKEKEDEKGKSR